MTETTSITVSPIDVRRELHDLVVADLLGPAGGDREVLADARERVSDRYLVGKLAPRGTVAFDPARHDRNGVDGDDAIGDPAEGRSLRRSRRCSLRPSG